ncbi:MAG: TolC family protein [Planctomycetes bacterium]|nr:TolC family protein [Planctomycetota bacterium]
MSWVLAGCAAPSPYAIGELEESEHRFVVPPRERSKIEEILAKDELTLADALEIADALNPRLEVERRNVDLATAAMWEASLYPNPSAILDVEDARAGRAERTAGLSVPVAIGGRLGAATDLAAKEREVAALRYVWRRREILTDVKRAFVNVLAAGRAVELARDGRRIAQTVREIAEERFKAQAVPEMEVLKAAVNLAKAEADVKLAERDLQVSTKALQALMGDADFPKDRFSGELASRFVVPGAEALRGLVMAGHPLLEAARLAREAAETRISLAEAQRIPDITVTVTVGKDSEEATIVEGGVEVPLPIFNRNQAAIMEAEIRKRQAELEAVGIRNDLLLQLTEAIRTFVSAQERVALYVEEILPKAEQALRQTEEGYRAGKFAHLDVLDAQRTLSEARFAAVTALSDLNLAAAEVEKLSGVPLERIR